MPKSNPTKTCFVIGRIGDAGSPTRGHADWLLDEIITPVFEEHFKDFEVVRSDKITQPGMIDSQVINNLLAAFESAWRVFLSKRTEADFQGWRNHQAWTAEKYRRFDRGERMPHDWRAIGTPV